MYFVEAIGLDRIKIGFARTSLRERLAGLRNASPVELEALGFIEGDRLLESRLHREFAHLRRIGEWFEATEELRRYIRENASTGTYGPETGRTRVKVLISIHAADLDDLDEIARDIAAPGKAPNRSDAIMWLVRRRLAARRK